MSDDHPPPVPVPPVLRADLMHFAAALLAGALHLVQRDLAPLRAEEAP